LIRLIQDLLQADINRRPPTAAVVIDRFADAVGLGAASLETDDAFRQRLDAEAIALPPNFDRAARNWHAGLRVEIAEGGDDKHPAVLVFDDPSGFDGRRVMDDLCDRGAVGGARVVRISLTHRAYEPLESLEPALAVFRRLREQRSKGRYTPPLRGLAGAATMLTRLHGPTILSIENLQRADVLTLELLASVFTGAANANLRIVATVDPAESPVAPHAFETLVTLGLVARVQPEPLELAQVRAWLDKVVGAGVVEESAVRALLMRSDGVPGRLRALVGEEFAQGRIRRVPHGYLVDRALGIGQIVPDLGATPLDDLLACLIHAFPEDVVRAYLGDAADFMPHLFQSGDLVRHDSGRISVGDADRLRERYRRLDKNRRHALHRRLAEAIAGAPKFSGQASASAREWLRTGQPILATPYLVAAANDAADRMDATAAAEHLSRAQNLLTAHATTSAPEQAFRFQVQVSRTAVRLARIAGDFGAWREEATSLFEAAVHEGHVTTMQEALEALIDLAAETRDWAKLAQHADARAALHGAAPADGQALQQWAFAVRALAEGDLDEVEARVDRGLELEPRAGVALRLMAIDAESLVAYQQVRRAAEAISAFDKKAREVGTLTDRAMAVLLAAANARELQRPAEALDLLERLSTELGDVHLRRISGRVELEFSRCHIDLGWLPTALDHAERARALAERDRDPEVAIAARVAEARTVALLGQPEDALELLGDVREDLHAECSRALAFDVDYAETEVAIVCVRSSLPEELVDVARRLATGAFCTAVTTANCGGPRRAPPSWVIDGTTKASAPTSDRPSAALIAGFLK
ncbi:MAG: tetratricopeptide repeat protein, partial [Myxococcales bacterium]|nr:tetratricopeptide repeat protein [Myxococcales bacterium]